MIAPGAPVAGEAAFNYRAPHLGAPEAAFMIAPHAWGS
jgi:hypothetical protein